jgi:hypothetical protein
VRFENEDNVDQPYYELLKKKWSEVKDLPRYKEAQPVENNFCSRSYYKRMRLLTMEEYSALGPGLQIQHATSSPSAVADDQGNLLHLQASGVTILYDSPNSEMYPFQTDVSIELLLHVLVDNLSASATNHLLYITITVARHQLLLSEGQTV